MSENHEQDLRDALLKLGVSPEVLDSLDLAGVDGEVAAGVMAAAAVPASQRGRVGAALILDEMITGNGQAAAAGVMQVAGQAAMRPGGVESLLMIVASIAAAAAMILPEDDPRTPVDFLDLASEPLRTEEASERFDTLRREWHALQAYQDIREDLKRITEDPDSFGDLLQ